LEMQLVSPDGKFVFARDVESKGVLYPLDGSQAEEVRGLQPREDFGGWAADSRNIYVFRPDVYPVKVFRLDVTTGARKLIREIMPGDPVGLDSVYSVRVSHDEKSIAYSYQRSLSELYLVTGLK
jgi:hypothetical protein